MAVRKRMADGETGDGRDNVVEAPITPRRLTVSDILRGRRVECGLEIPHVAEALRIRAPILEAIEDGRFDDLPGPAYSVGFIRSYAAYLGLDAEALVMRFKTESSGATNRPKLYFPLPVRDSHVPTGPLLLVCLLLAVLIYGGWYYVNAGPERLADWVPPVPDRLRHLLASDQAAPQPTTPTPAPAVAAAAPVQVQPPASQAPQPAAAPAPAPAAVATPSQPQPAVDGAPPVESRQAQAPATVPPPPDIAQPAVSADTGKAGAISTSYGAPETEARIVLRANADTWIQVRDGNSNLLFTRVLKPGETYNVPNQPGLTLIAGNAGGLDIAVDGTGVPHLGETGRVIRNVSLDPDRLLGALRHAN